MDSHARRVLGTLYKQGRDADLQTISARVASEAPASTPRRDILRAYQSAKYLADHMSEVTVLAIPCIAGRPGKASAAERDWQLGLVLPAVWSFMLAAPPEDWAPAGQHCTSRTRMEPRTYSASHATTSCRRQ